MQSALGRGVPRETIKSFGREIPYSSKQIPCSFLCREFRVQVIEGDFLGTELIEMEVIAGRISSLCATAIAARLK
jgi:hypothetical protein